MYYDFIGSKFDKLDKGLIVWGLVFIFIFFVYISIYLFFVEINCYMCI